MVASVWNCFCQSFSCKVLNWKSNDCLAKLYPCWHSHYKNKYSFKPYLHTYNIACTHNIAYYNIYHIYSQNINYDWSCMNSWSNLVVSITTKLNCWVYRINTEFHIG